MKHITLALFILSSSLFSSLGSVAKSQSFYSLNEMYVYGRINYNFYKGVDVNLGVNFRVPITRGTNFPMQFELNYFGEGLNMYGKTVGLTGIGASLNSYYAFMDLGERFGILPLEYIGFIYGFSTFYEFYAPSNYLKAPELASKSKNFSWGINVAPIIKIKFSDKMSGFFQYTMYLLPTSPFGIFRNTLGIGIQYNL